MKNKTKGAAVKDGAVNAVDSAAAAGQLKREGEDGDVKGPGRMGYTQNFGAARQGGYAKGAAKVNSIMKGAAQISVDRMKLLELSAEERKMKATNTANLLSERGTAGYVDSTKIARTNPKLAAKKYKTTNFTGRASEVRALDANVIAQLDQNIAEGNVEQDFKDIVKGYKVKKNVSYDPLADN
tara:strand:- start:332 stop:880 length:549 start_codon:yes stop_codon:yes gene_type:complete